VSGSTELAEVLSNCLPNPFGKLRGESFGFAQDSEPVELLAEPPLIISVYPVRNGGF